MLITTITHSGNLLSGQVGSPHLANVAVRSGHIDSGQITQNHVASGALTQYLLVGGKSGGQSGQGGPIAGDNFSLTASAVSGTGNIFLNAGQITNTAAVSMVINTPSLQLEASGSLTINWLDPAHVFTTQITTKNQSGNIAYTLPSHSLSGGVLTLISSGSMEWRIPTVSLTSGQVTSGFLGNNAALSGNIGSGQLWASHFASGFLIPGSGISITFGLSGITISATNTLGSGSIGSGMLQSGSVQGQYGTRPNIASGTAGTHDLGSGTIARAAQFLSPFASGTAWTAITGEIISGVRAVALTGSGLRVVSSLYPTSGGNAYAGVGIVWDNLLSGVPATVYQAGFLQFGSGLADFSGYVGKNLYISYSGTITPNPQPVSGVLGVFAGEQQSVGIATNSGGAAFLMMNQPQRVRHYIFHPTVSGPASSGDAISLILPSHYEAIFMQGIGGGGGGGSGRRAAASNAKAGGGGGAGGAYAEKWAPRSQVFFGSDRLFVTPGTAGMGGSGQTVNTTDGNNGQDGGDSVVNRPAGVGTLSGHYLRAGGGAGGLGGTDTVGTGGAAKSYFVEYGGAGGNGGTNAATTTAGSRGAGRGAGGGAGGGGVNAGNVASSGEFGGAAGGNDNVINSGGTPGSFTAAGGVGGSSVFGNPYGGGGGGGGAGASGSQAGGGGSGGFYGGGGGGAGAVLNGNNGQPGGQGGIGVIVVTIL